MTDIRRMTTSAWRLRAGNHVPAIGAGVRPYRDAANGMQDNGGRVSAQRSAM